MLSSGQQCCTIVLCSIDLTQSLFESSPNLKLREHVCVTFPSTGLTRQPATPRASHSFTYISRLWHPDVDQLYIVSMPPVDLNSSLFLAANRGPQVRNLVDKLDFHGTMNLALADASAPYLARKKLLNAFKDHLRLAGLPTKFFDILEHNNAVLSGSFAQAFLDKDLCFEWTKTKPSQRDVDIYVGKGMLDNILHDINSLPGYTVTEKFRTVNPLEANGPFEDGDDERVLPFYENPAIWSMARLTLTASGGRICHMDVVESKSLSPLEPIVAFDLSHLRVGINVNGIFEFHPDWHINPRVSFVSPRVYKDDGETVQVHQQRFLLKYRLRGYTLIDSIENNSDSAGKSVHYCFASVDCPLTMRSTTDAGVKFVPFTEEAALAAMSEKPAILTEPVVYWRHGGFCKNSPGTSVSCYIGGSAEESE